MTIIVLCGGRGTRLGELTNSKPKALIDVGGQTIIDRCLSRHRGNRFILSTGYLGGLVRAHFDHTENISYCEEKEPLGTGGAVRFCSTLVFDDYFGVLNGDTVVDVDLNWILKNFSKCGISKLACVVVCKNSLSGKDEFSGVFLFRREFVNYITPGSASLESAVDSCRKDGKVIFYVSTATFYDLGTPEGIKSYLSTKKMAEVTL